jgi:transcriptional regulator with XRE-family HTH domain
MEGTRQAVPDLAAIRQRRGLSLEHIAATTKISLFYLRAIEAGEIRKLPGSFYALSYVRQYARAIDYDEHELVERYQLGRAVEEDIPVQPVTFRGRIAQLTALVFRIFDAAKARGLAPD